MNAHVLRKTLVLCDNVSFCYNCSSGITVVITCPNWYIALVRKKKQSKEINWRDVSLRSLVTVHWFPDCIDWLGGVKCFNVSYCESRPLAKPHHPPLISRHLAVTLWSISLSLLKSIVLQFESITYWFYFHLWNGFSQIPVLALKIALLVHKLYAWTQIYCCLDSFPMLQLLSSHFSSVLGFIIWYMLCRRCVTLIYNSVLYVG